MVGILYPFFGKSCGFGAKDKGCATSVVVFMVKFRGAKFCGVACDVVFLKPLYATLEVGADNIVAEYASEA